MPPRSPVVTGTIIFFLLVALSVAAFQLFKSEAVDPDPTTTTAPADGTDTSEATGDGDDTTTTTATTSSTPTTLVPVTPYEAVGDPIPLGDLDLKAAGIGPIEFGTNAAQAMGQLTASLGAPDEDTGFSIATGAFGACPGDTVRIIRWGPLATVVIRNGVTETFEGFRLDLNYGGITSDAASLTTLSGLSAGNTVADLNEIYGASFRIDYVVDSELGTVFQVLGSEGQLLLWGPVSSTESDGKVFGIYARNACGA